MFHLPKEIIEGIEEYRIALRDFLQGKLSAARFRGIRVPWGIYNQRGGRSFMVRVRIPSGELSLDQLIALAAASQRYGNGALHVTTRQDIQIHNVNIEDTIKIIDYLKDYDLSPRGGGGNTIRNIAGCPLAGLCEDEPFDIRPYVIGLSGYLLKDPDSYMLPRKFKIAFSGCEKDCAMATITDLGFIAKEKDGIRGFRVYAGGGMGANTRVGTLLEDFVRDSEVGYVAEAVKKTFIKYGERKDRHHARLRFLVEKMGVDRFKQLYKEEVRKLLDSEYIALKEAVCEAPPQIDVFKESSGSGDDFNIFEKFNVKKESHKGYAIVELRIPLGDIGAEETAALTKIAGIIKTISFRASQRQNLYMINVPLDKLAEVYNNLKEAGLARPYASSAEDVVCCAGATTCNLGFCNSKGLAAELTNVLKGLNIREDLLKGVKININGCPNSCGQHPIGTIGLHGLARKVRLRNAPFYRVFVGGIAEEGKTAVGIDAGIVPARNVPFLVRDFFINTEEELKIGDDIHSFMIDRGVDIMKKIVEKYAYLPDFEEDESFYKDWGKDEVFSLEGLAQGECGAGAIDMIEADLNDARKNLLLAKDSGYGEEHIKEALHLASRALLVVRGLEPHTIPEAFDYFEKEFIDKKIASNRFRGMAGVYEKGIKDKKEFYQYAEHLYNEVKGIYDSMDSSFNFQVKPAEGGGAKEEMLVLDLKGVSCPLNYVKTKLYLENLPKDAVVDVYLDDGEPIANVPKSLEADGQQILEIKKEDGYFIVRVKKLR